jgi:hypothetical protein
MPVFVANNGKRGRERNHVAIVADLAGKLFEGVTAVGDVPDLATRFCFWAYRSDHRRRRRRRGEAFPGTIVAIVVADVTTHSIVTNGDLVGDENFGENDRPRRATMANPTVADRRPISKPDSESQSGR